MRSQPDGLSFEVIALVTLFFVPAVVPVTLTAKVHAPLPASVAPNRLTPFDPAVAVIVPPPQLPVSPLGVETTRPAGNVSVKATPVSDVSIGIADVEGECRRGAHDNAARAERLADRRWRNRGRAG